MFVTFYGGGSPNPSNVQPILALLYMTVTGLYQLLNKYRPILYGGE